MGAAAAPLMIVGSAVTAGAAYMGFRNTAESAQDQGQIAMISAQMQALQLQAMAGMQSAQASAFRTQAEIAKKTGELQQAANMYRATQTQTEAEKRAQRAATLRRQFVGEGKVKFAANGVLLEGRPQSAVAMWEQDEATDLAMELQGIKTMADNEVFGYIWNGFNARMQGLLDAEGLNMQAQASEMSAANSLLNADLAILQGESVVAQGQAASESALWGFLGSLGGTALNFGNFAADGGFSRTKSSDAPKTSVAKYKAPARPTATYGGVAPRTGGVKRVTGYSPSPFLE